MSQIALDVRMLRDTPRDSSVERACEDFVEGEQLKLMQWAVLHAPQLIRLLRIAYLFGHDGVRPPQAVARQSIAAAIGDLSRWLPEPTNAARNDLHSERLKDVEREHIRKVLEESASAVEAAVRLGINASTLWRKRKRYNL